MNNTLQVIRNAVLSAPAVRGIRIVGIDGPSGSGESTLAAKLAPLLNAPIIPIDDFVSWNNFEGHRALWHQWMDEEDKFFTADKTRLRADLIIPGT